MESPGEIHDAWRSWLSIGAALVVHASLGLAGWGATEERTRSPSEQPFEVAVVYDEAEIPVGPDASGDSASSELDASGMPEPVQRAVRAKRIPTAVPEPPNGASGAVPAESPRRRDVVDSTASSPPPEPPVQRVAAAAASEELGGKARGDGDGGGSGSGLPGDGGGRSSGAGGGDDSLGALGHEPRLVVNGDPCRGVFPFDAQQNRGRVTVALRVAETGVPTTAQVVDEQPAGQGFAEAARLCARRLMFEPATNALGQAISGSSVVRLTFARRH